MPSFSISYNQNVGPLIQVVMLGPGIIPTSAPSSPIPKLYMALIDTGASHTAITQKVITDLGLVPRGKVPVGGNQGMAQTNHYMFQLGLSVVQGAPNAAGIVTANVISYPLQGPEFVTSGPFDVLLGRDVLCRGVFSMSFDGHAIFSI